MPVPGTITTIAGDGSGGYCNDGDPAIDACMSPVGLVYDSSGNYYIGDYGSDRVREVKKSTGDISTIFGWGPNGGTQPNYSDPVGVINVAGGNPSLYYPAGVYADPTSNNVYIGGYDGESVYKWNSGTNDLSGFAGNGAAGFEGDGGPADSAATELNSPWGIARDGSGNIYIGDYNNCVIREVSESTGDITTIAGGSAGHQDGCGYTADGGTAINTQMNSVSSIAILAAAAFTMPITTTAWSARSPQALTRLPRWPGITLWAADTPATSVRRHLRRSGIRHRSPWTARTIST